MSILTKEEYEKLKEIDIMPINRIMQSAIRSDTDASDYFPLVISILFLALLGTKKEVSTLHSFVGTIFESETVIEYLRELIITEEEVIQTLSSKFDEDSLKAAVLFSTLKQHIDPSYQSTPSELSQLAMELLSIEDGDVIMDLGSGVGNFVNEVGFLNNAISVYGVEIKTKNIIVSTLRSYIINKNIRYRQGNIVSQDWSEIKASKVFSHFPLGGRMQSVEKYLLNNVKLASAFENTKRTITSDWVYVLAAYYSMKPGGKCVCLISNSGTWNKADEEIRHLLLKEGAVEGIIALPPNILQNTPIPITMVVLSGGNRNVKMVDASEMFTKGRKQNTLTENAIKKISVAYWEESEDSVVVSLEKLKNNGYVFNPIRYMEYDDDIKDGYTLSEVAVSINRSIGLRANELDEAVTTERTGYRYLRLQDIDEGIVAKNLQNLKEESEKDSWVLVQNNDLIVSKNSPFKIAMANFESKENVIAGGNLYLIKIDENKINPVFVEVFLQSEAGLVQLTRHSKGAVFNSISLEDLKKVKIPKVSREVQNQIADEYAKLKEQLIVIERQVDLIKDRRAKLLEGVV